MFRKKGKAEKDTLPKSSFNTKTLLDKPKIIDGFTEKYILLYDDHWGGTLPKNFSKIMNLMARRDWRCISFNVQGKAFYALMEKQIE